MVDDSKQRMAWFREARFGMMVTWGIYALEAAGEWVQYKRRIPIREYGKLASRFNPVGFDAKAWVHCAQDAGMKYLVAMARHHDGFAMFPSQVSPYNIIDATPWKRDFLGELAAACRAAGLHFGLYFSHVRDWYHPHATSLEPHTLAHFGNYGNFWDYPREELKNLQTFLDEVSLPQLREVLERYQPDLLWFDTPSMIRPDQAQQFHDLVRSLCPHCLINSRIGKTAASDYLSCGDNEIPELDGIDFETPMVMNGAWGYNTQPEKVYLPAEKFIADLIATASRGGNYLLNVGPGPLGRFQPDATARLQEIGSWLAVNGEAIYGTTALSLPQPTWGKITAKPDAGTLYLFVHNRQPEIMLRGLDSEVSKCTLLETRAELPFARRDFAGMTRDLLLTLPEGSPREAGAPRAASAIAVIRVELAEPLRVCPEPIEDEQGTIMLKISRGALGKPGWSAARVSLSNTTEDWREDDVAISWNFTAAIAGDYAVEAELKTDFFGEWDSGYTLHATCGKQQVSAVFELPKGYISKLCSYESKVLPLGSLALAAGRHTVTVFARDVGKTLTTWRGVNLAAVCLRRHRE